MSDSRWRNKARKGARRREPRPMWARLSGWTALFFVVGSTGYLVQQRIAARPMVTRSGARASGDGAVGAELVPLPQEPTVEAPSEAEPTRGAEGAPEPVVDTRSIEADERMGVTGGDLTPDIESSLATELSPLPLQGTVSDEYRATFDAFQVKRTFAGPAAFSAVAQEGATAEECALASASYAKTDLEGHLQELATFPEPPAPVYWAQETYREVLMELSHVAEEVRAHCSPEIIAIYTAAWDEEARHWDAWVREYELAGGTARVAS